MQTQDSTMTRAVGDAAEPPHATTPDTVALSDATSPGIAQELTLLSQLEAEGDDINKVSVGADSPQQPDKPTAPQTFFVYLQKMIPPGGALSTVFNLCSICVGAGILGLPAAANSSGLAMAAVYPIAIAAFSTYSLYCLAVTIEKLGTKTYEQTARTLLGRGFDYVTAGIRLFNTFGGLVAFLMSVCNIIEAVVDHIESAPAFLKSISGYRFLTTLLWLVVMLPLVIPRRINSLRYVSTIGIVFIIYFVVMLVVHSCINGLPENVKRIHLTGNTKDEGIHLIGTGNTALSGLGVFMFAFISQVNAFEVYWDVKNHSASRFTLYSAIAMVVCLALYFITAMFSYLDFGSSVTGSVLLMYDPIKEPAVMVAYFGVLVKLCSSYPLVAMASRNSIYYTIGWDADSVPFWKHCVTAVLIATVSLLFALFIPQINLVFGLVGAVCGGFLGFIFPALFVMYSGQWSLRSVGWMHYILTYALLLTGVIATVFGTVATVYSAFVA